MIATIEQLLDAALALPVDERIELAEALVASIEPSEHPLVDDAMKEMLRSRAAEIDSGKVTLVPRSDVQRQIREIIGE